MRGMLLISTHFLNPFWKSELFDQWDNEMDINPDNKTSYTT